MQVSNITTNLAVIILTNKTAANVSQESSVNPPNSGVAMVVNAFLSLSNAMAPMIAQVLPLEKLLSKLFESFTLDGSDEVGCVQPTVVQPPDSNKQVPQGDTFQLTCRAVAVPEAYINWRLNWGPVCDPPRCVQESEGGVGTLTVTNAQPMDQGGLSDFFLFYITLFRSVYLRSHQRQGSRSRNSRLYRQNRRGKLPQFRVK